VVGEDVTDVRLHGAGERWKSGAVWVPFGSSEKKIRTFENLDPKKPDPRSEPSRTI
jgi:hypothetical protein